MSHERRDSIGYGFLSNSLTCLQYALYLFYWRRLSFYNFIGPYPAQPVDHCVSPDHSAHHDTCAEYAIRFTRKENKYQMRKNVYSFLMTKILEVLRKDAAVLSDERTLIGFYQRTVYFDASGAAEKTRLQDEPVMNAVTKSFAYCEALFNFIPDSFLRRNKALNEKAAEIARQWQTTYSYVAMRVGLYHLELTREQIHYGLSRYARYLRAVKNREALMQEIAPYNTIHADQSLFLMDE